MGKPAAQDPPASPSVGANTVPPPGAPPAPLPPAPPPTDAPVIGTVVDDADDEYEAFEGEDQDVRDDADKRREPSDTIGAAASSNQQEDEAWESDFEDEP